mgnify:CR=1 FL=1
MEETRVCKRCGKLKSLAENFWFDKRIGQNRAPGYHVTCKDCKNLQKRVRRAGSGSRNTILKFELEKVLGYQPGDPEFNSLLETKLIFDRDIKRAENSHIKISGEKLVVYCSRCFKFEIAESHIDVSVLVEMAGRFRKYHNLCR